MIFLTHPDQNNVLYRLDLASWSDTNVLVVLKIALDSIIIITKNTSFG